jgi:protein SCO1
MRLQSTCSPNGGRCHVGPVFISVDPERDTPEVVADFAANMHPRMIGLTGSPEQVKAASQAYRAYYRKHDDDEEFYLVDHSTFTYLMLPEDRLCRVLPPRRPARRDGRQRGLLRQRLCAV